MLSVLYAAALLLILANLLIILVLFLLVFRALHKFIGEETLNSWSLEGFVPKEFPFNRKKEKPQGVEEGNRYTPEDAPTGENVPLDEFVPNFDKPIKVVYEEAGEDHGMKIEEDKDA